MGFLSNMFNLKTKYVDDPSDPADQAPKETVKTFYLDPNDAKTLGGKAKPVQDSSSGDKVLDTPDKVVKDTALKEVDSVIEPEAKVDKLVTPEPETTSSEPSESSSQDTAPTDDGMDMFRNMARKIKKR